MTDDRFRLCTRSSQRLLVFARAPEEGVVKSRLSSAIGSHAAFEIYRAMVRELLDRFEGNDAFDVEVMWTAESASPGPLLSSSFGPFRLARQIGRDLGERMTVAFSERALLQRTTRIIGIGTDLPDLTPADIQSAFALLESCDWVIGPAVDGGYYLIGCRAKSFDSRIFEGIPWGQSSVLQATIDRIRELGETVALLPERRDIDHAEDLFEYVERNREGEVARVTASLGLEQKQ